MNPFDWMPVVGLARTFQQLPERLQSTFVQLMTMSATEFLQQWFETDPLIATMSASGIIGTFQGVRSPGTAYVLLHHYMGEIDGAFRAWGIPRGGTGSISNAIASAARGLGAEIRTEAPVARIAVKNGRATGVVLESGEAIQAKTVLSSVDSHVTFLKLMDPSDLDQDFREEVQRYKFRGSSGKVNLALDGLPELACKPGRGEWLRGAISFSPGVDYMERAYDDAKYGRFSRRPYIDCIIPTLVDPSMAPPGKHVMSCFVQYAPYHLSDGRAWDDAERDAFGETVIATLEERFPKIRDLILHQQVLTPLDIERITGLTEGNIFQGELSLEQLFFNRPVPGWARYRTPVKRLWMCGSATHPGGGIMGAPGRIAALELLKSGSKEQVAS
jgi:phytoene dehydrogenase-like protein